MKKEEVNRYVGEELENKDRWDQGVPGDDNVDYGLPTGRNNDEFTSARLEDSFENAENAEPEELSEILDELVEEVARIAEKLPTEEADQLAESLKKFTAAGTEVRPQRDFWEEYMDTIKVAAESVGEIGVLAINLLADAIPLLEKKERAPKG